MMKKILGLFCLVSLSLFGGAISLASQAQLYRVGVLYLENVDNPVLNGLVAGLQDLGYVEGNNLVLDIGIGQSLEELRGLAKDFGRKRMDVVVIVGGKETKVVRQVTGEIPIVFAPAGDPVEEGLVKSLARPETNMTGLSYVKDFEMYGKLLEVFKEVVPALRRIFVLYDAGEGIIPATILPFVRETANNLGLELTERSVNSIAEAEDVVSSLSGQTTDGIFPICKSFFRNIKKIAAIAVEKRISLYACSARQVASYEALLTYAPDLHYMGYRGAWYVDRILKGAKPQDLPVETPTRYELVINLKAAKKIGLTIPPEVLIRADKVIR